MASFEKIETNKVKITFEVSADKFAEGIKFAFGKNKSKFAVPGFRQGKVPQKLIEKMYGADVFFDDAINHIFPEAFDAVVTELGLSVVSRPEVDIVKADVNEGVTLTAEAYTKPEIDAVGYKGAKCEKVETEVTEEEIKAEIDKTLEKNSRLISITDRTAKDGDIVIINFEGFVDGVAFQGGKAEDYELVLGSHSFIDTFEDQIVGKNIGDEFDVNVNFPENYGSEELSGKPAVFKVKLNEIKFKELPAADDDFAQDVSEFETYAEYKNDVKSKLAEKKLEAAKNEKESKVMESVLAANDFEIPQAMIDNQADSMLREFSHRLQEQGLNIENYCKYTGMTLESIVANYKDGAKNQVKGRLILEAVAKQEKLEASEEEVNEEISKIAAAYGMELEKLAEVMRDEERTGVANDVKVQKAMDFIMANSVEVEKAAEEKPEKAEKPAKAKKPKAEKAKVDKAKTDKED